MDKFFKLGLLALGVYFLYLYNLSLQNGLRRGSYTRMSIDDAIRHHEAGRLREAEQLYRSMLGAEPHHPDALHLLGVLLTQLGELDDAVELIQAALNVDRAP